MAQFKIDPEYKEVSERIGDFFKKHPEGSLQPINPQQPFQIVKINYVDYTIDKETGTITNETPMEANFVVYAAAAFRGPDDNKPSVGVAWEPFPGKTPYTRNSELQNAETSAWGRAIISLGASTAKHIASANEVRNRQAENEDDARVITIPSPRLASSEERATAAGEAATSVPGYGGGGQSLSSLAAVIENAFPGTTVEDEDARSPFEVERVPLLDPVIGLPVHAQAPFTASPTAADVKRMGLTELTKALHDYGLEVRGAKSLKQQRLIDYLTGS